MKNANSPAVTPLTRRQLLIAGVAAGSTPLLLTGPAGAVIRVPQSAVHFTREAKTSQTCGLCKHFVAPSSCRFVDGEISEGCSCWVWMSRTA